MELVISALFSLKLRETYYVMSYIFRELEALNLLVSMLLFLGSYSQKLPKSSQFRGYYHAYIVRTCTPVTER